MSGKDPSKENGGGEVAKEQAKPSPLPAEASPRGWPKGKKRYPKSPGSPKQPLSGYVHFLNFRRDSVRKECPEMSFAEISKKLAQEWSQLEAVEKQIYVKKAEEDKERYNREFTEYQRTDAYKDFVALQNEKENRSKSDLSPSHGQINQSASTSGSKKKKNRSKDKVTGHPIKVKKDPESPSAGGVFLDIPIFREEFLEHNKGRENELKQLRKQAIEFEEQNAILLKHVENMKSAISKLESETGQHQENNQALEKHLEALRKLVIINFGGLTLPTPTTPATPLSMANVDEFVEKLHTLVVEKPKENERLVATVKDISRKIDYSSVST